MQHNSRVILAKFIIDAIRYEVHYNKMCQFPKKYDGHSITVATPNYEVHCPIDVRGTCLP